MTALPLTFYDAKYYRASPTWNTWVKCTATFVHGLQSEPGFYGQALRYFHLNHPVQYLSLTGPIVAIDDISPRYTILTLDDGSGATIELKIIRELPDETTNNGVDSAPSNTAIANVSVRSWKLGHFAVFVDDIELNIGTVVKAKGIIDEFRGVRQLELKRIWLLPSTNEEVAAWRDIAAHMKLVSKPWLLSAEQIAALDQAIQEEVQAARRAERKREERKALREDKKKIWEERMKKYEEKQERRRRREEAMFNASAIDKDAPQRF